MGAFEVVWQVNRHRDRGYCRQWLAIPVHDLDGILQVGDTVYDSSLRSRLKQLKGRLVEKAFNEIQSGRDRFSHPEGD